MEMYEEIVRAARLLLQGLPEPVGIVDPEDRPLWVNEAFESRYGPLEQLADPHRMFRPGVAGLQADMIRTPISDGEGRTIAYTVMLKERMEHYRIIAENTSDTIVLVDHRATVRYVSPSLRPLTGYSPETYEGMDAFEIIHPDDRARARRVHEQAWISKRPTEIAYRVIHAEGHTIHIESRVKPVLDGAGEVEYVVAVARDVSERKQTEQLLENILENVNAAVWSSDKEFTRYTFCSESIEKISGIPRKEIIANPLRLHDHIHPEDHAVIMGEVKSKLGRGMPVSRDFRSIHAEGETRWGRLIVHPWLDHTGAVERLDGLILDITDKIRSELALEESEQRYKSLFENNLDGVFSIELNGFYFVNANRSFETITGIEISRLTDRCFLGIIYDEDHPLVYGTLHEVIRQGRPRYLECRLDHSRYGEKIVGITFVPIFLAGELNGIHGIVKDITVRKMEERELIRSEERYKFLQQSLNRFSNDVANVMKVSELERRLLEEVEAVLPVARASVEEVPGSREDAPPDPQEIRIRIGERQHPIELRIAVSKPLLRIEEEWLETAAHYVAILYDNLHRIEDLMKRLEHMVKTNETPKWMLRLLFRLSEKERASLSGDLHDSVLQDLIIWYRKVESLHSTRDFEPEAKRELEQIGEGLLDAIHQLRITCNELRPPFLLKMGLVESLKSLFEYTRMFANYEIEFTAEPADAPLQEDQILGMYRIVQELLNNASKHSKAGKVTMSLGRSGDTLRFMYSDDGVGLELSALEGSFQHMGIAGIEKRVLSLEGKVEFRSAPRHGFHVAIQFPIWTQVR